MAVNHADVVGRYLNLFDRLPEKGSVIDDLVALFAPDAVIRLFEGQEPIEGRGAIRQVYADFAEALVDTNTSGSSSRSMRKSRSWNGCRPRG